MGKSSGKKKKPGSAGKLSETNSRNSRSSDYSPKDFDEDVTKFMDMAQDMKEEGNRLFQKRDYEGARFNYEKAIKLLPKNHIDVAYLHSNIAACYMQMGPDKCHRAIDECNLALEVSPMYNKALLKRARCFETLNKFDLACKDVELVLSLEPNNLTALEISERVRKSMDRKGSIKLDDKTIVSLPEIVVVKEKTKKKKSHKIEEKFFLEEEKQKDEKQHGVKEKHGGVAKLVYGEDIRWAQLPTNCTMHQLRDIVGIKFPSLKSILIKYKDKEGDLVTITTSEELRWAEESTDPQGSLRLYITEVDPGHETLVGEKNNPSRILSRKYNSMSDYSVKNDYENISPSYLDNYVIQFARLFKNHVGFNSDACLNLHEVGMKFYSEAMEETTTNEEAQEIFEIAKEKFQEMAALALFNWGNVHMSRARKRLILSEDALGESLLDQVKVAYEWAQFEYVKAGQQYEEALRIKSDFYEALFALGQQQFEQAKLSWCYAIGSKVDMETWPSNDVLELFNNAEDNIERGIEMWEDIEDHRVKKELSKPNEEKLLFQKMGLDDYFEELSPDEETERASNMRSQINILWGTVLYERSIVEFRIGLPMWEECLMAAIEKFKVAGASPSDIAVMIKNHCANETTPEGLGFNIDEIVQAWNEMYDAKRWLSGVSSFRLEPLLRRRIPKLHQMMEHI